MTDTWIGSELVVSEENVQQIVSGLVAETLRVVDSSDDYIEIHNTFTAYSIMLLFSATGHRPVQDPFCYRADYCLDLGMMMIEDKVVSERHRYRLVALPDIAITQLGNYQKHLKWLASKLIVDPKSNGLENAVHHVLSANIARKEHELPLFFFLEMTNKKIKTISINETLLKNFWGELWPLPYNYSRHNIATQMRRIRITQEDSSLSIEAIEAHLGHQEGLSHPFGSSSVTSPLDYQQQISAPLNELLIRQKWRTLSTKRAFRNLDHLHRIDWKHSDLKLGPVEREYQRKSRRAADEETVDRYLDQYSEEDLVTNSSLINTIRQEIIGDSQNDKDRINVRLIFLWKKLIAIKERRPDFVLPRRLHIIDTEPSPFDESSIITYKVAANVRRDFINYLEREGNRFAKYPDKSIAYYTRASEILISAAMFDAITNKEVLEKLSLSKLYLTQESNIRYMDVMNTNKKGKENLIWRWMPQPLSIALIDGLDRKLVSNSRMKYFNQKSFINKLVDLLAYLGVSEINEDNVYSRLAELSQSFWLMHAPPYLREIASGSCPVQPLAESSLVRILRQERLKSDPNEENLIKIENPPTLVSYALRTKESSHHIKNARKFTSDLRGYIKSAEKHTGRNGKSASFVRKDVLNNMLHDCLSSEHDYPSIGVALASWCSKLCTKGTDLYGTIAFSTVKGYVNMVTTALAEISCKTNFFNLDPDQYDYVYEIAIEVNKHADQTKLLNNLKDFHNFLVSARLASEIDWGYISQEVYSNRISGSVDANIITSTEYLIALNLIFKAGENGQLEKRISMLYCALLILGYHFGLRISEAFHLQYRHIQHNATWSCVVVHVSNTLFGDTKSSSGRRQIPLTANLTELERTVIKIVFDPQVITHKDEQASIFSLDNETRVLINKMQASLILNSTLKQVTGDPKSHYHLLRHSFNSRIYPQFYDLDKSTFNSYIEKLSMPYLVEPSELRVLMTGRDGFSSKILKSLTIAAGHARVTTTFNHYIHTADHYIYHNASQSILWSNFDFGRIDYITSYAHLLSLETTKKRRDRDGVGTKDLFGALAATTNSVKFHKASVATVHHPENEIFDMNIKVGNQDVTLVMIDKIILLHCVMADAEASIISERLYVEKDYVLKVIELFHAQKLALGYLGYNDRCGMVSDSPCNYDSESPSETIALHNILPDIYRKLELLDAIDLEKLLKGMTAWGNAYYPNNRYRPLVFSSPNDVDDFISAMAIINIHPSEMMVTSDKLDGDWYKLDLNPPKLILNTNNEITEFEISHVSIDKKMPLPLSRLRITNKERISISVGKNTKSYIAYQKRLHRLCFIISIYVKMKEIAS